MVDHTDDRKWLTPREEALVQRAVDRSVRQTFLKLGIKITDEEDVIEAQRDFRWLRDLRTSSDKGGRAVLWVAISTFVVGLCSALWLGIQAALRINPPPP